MFDDFRAAYRNYHARKATASVAAGGFGFRLGSVTFPPRSGLAPLPMLRAMLRPALRAVARSRWTTGIGLAVLAMLAAAYEMQTSQFEARYFAGLAHEMWASPKPGASTAILFPKAGPYDQRLGYAALPQFISRLSANDFVVKDQARWSPGLLNFVKSGGFPVYREKDQGGLGILDRSGGELYGARFPQNIYRDFASVPPLIVKSLLFTEDRSLLNRGQPQRNAAIEWRRFVWAAFGRIARLASPHLKVGGGSTLATQIEKFRHSPRGLTDGAREKLRQVLTASMRIYLDGPDTTARREQVVRTYLNSTPLSSMGSYGEVIGLPEALRVWFGVENDDATRILNEEPADAARKAEVYREALSLILSARRPDYYLIGHRERLEVLIDRYLRVLCNAGVIDTRLRDAALNARLHFSTQPPPNTASAFNTQRAVQSVRNNLVSVLKLPDLYSLDRLDLKASTTIDAATQANVSAFLGRLSDPEFLKAQGMIGHQLLGDGDPAKVTYSFVLYERAGDHNDLRIRADSLNQPFDINSGAMLMLGSTAKLRTLATYLDIVRGLHRQFSGRTRHELLRAAAAAQDPLTLWAATYLSRTSDRGLQPMLDAAMARKYSGAPGAFFTGGGRQGFGNFEKSENRSNPTLALAFQHSINLAYVRLLRDIVIFYEAQSVPARSRLLSDPQDPDRRAYLQRFVDEDGRGFLYRFYKQFQGQSAGQMMAAMARQARPAMGPQAALYLSVHPDASFAELRAFLAARLGRTRVTDGEVWRVLATDSPARLSLQDLGYVSGVHPLELWLARYRNAHPRASWNEIASASGAVRQEVYAWLLKGSLRKQNARIAILLERAAFDRILDHWRSLGYPFEHLVPSLGTVVGASGDAPDALATLMGIILNDGVKLPTETVAQLRFAANTPYDTTLARRRAVPVRVMAPEIARTLRGALTGVVADGTASRLRGSFAKPDGSLLAIGGKTGTGDNRTDRFAPGGGVIASRALDRTATFVFFLGDRFFGTVTAYVPAPYAARYAFSSALAVQLLKALQPELQPLLGTARGGWTAPADPESEGHDLVERETPATFGD
jgi:membrane peptidoglycan carboxypeptidase